MLDALDVGRVVGVFDWEMSAVGDPLVDLGILLGYWVHTATGDRRDAVSAVTNREGWFTREELLERYGARTGQDLSGVGFYEVFAVFKLAVVLQQIFFLYRRGHTGDPRLSCPAARQHLWAVASYEVSAVFKLAVVLQQIFFRSRRGQTDDPRFAALGERVEWLARIATGVPAEK